MKKIIHIALFIYLSLISTQVATGTSTSTAIEILCYHDIRDDVDADLDADSTAISSKKLAAHFAWLQAKGYHPISIDDLLAAKAGTKALPSKPVLLTFDDGYKSFYTRAYPLLKLYQYPAVAALVGGWLDTNADNAQLKDPNLVAIKPQNMLSRAQIQEMAQSGLVEFASHSYDLHHGIAANPFGSQQPAATTLHYQKQSQQYETEAEFSARITADLKKNNAFIQSLTGKSPRVMVWPYGEYNASTQAIATQLGMPISLTLNENNRNHINSLVAQGRFLIDANPSESVLASYMLHKPSVDKQRAIHIDLDAIYDENPQQLEKNLDALIERIHSLAPSAVYLQAYADPDGDGVANAVYFPARHIKMRSDLFGRVSWQLRSRAHVQVYAWMPVLAFDLLDKPLQESLSVRSAKPEADAHNYRRLSPFAPQARQIIQDIYHDLATHADLSGVVFHDDATLSEHEDASPAALAAYQQALGGPVDLTHLNADQQARLTRFKTEFITQFTRTLAQELRAYHPRFKTARHFYAASLLNPQSERWLAQNYQNALENYDYVGIMAMPFMEEAQNPQAWLQGLVDKVQAAKGMNKTLFVLQSKDWRKRAPIADATLTAQMQLLYANGALHTGYYPDDFIGNHPDIEQIRPYISTRVYPYLPLKPAKERAK